MGHGITHVVHQYRRPVKKLRQSWARLRTEAQLGPYVTPNTPRHGAVCWQLQAGVPAWEVAGWAGMSVEMIG